ncbi:MAG: hypothetical protein HY046_01280 [Acidobacteria bacterium]|nr:hypothetical protein [Acidobacteriota bacterium]
MNALAGNEPAILLACLALAAATVIFIFWIERDPSDSAPHRSRLDQMLDRRDAIYENLRDLRFEHRSGKFSEADYEGMRNSMETEAAIVLAEIEKLSGAEPQKGSRPAASGHVPTAPGGQG